MNKIVFISGSRHIKELPQSALDSLDKIIELGLRVIVGDCQGVDSLVQKYLKSKNYTKVTVYHIGNYPRFNLGFKTVKVQGTRQVDKDIEMSNKAHYGLTIWDGKSKGTKNNIDRVPLTKVIKV
jgi:adenine-specific DNA-methyltransferase